ncbi:alpha/beta hydrolase [Rubrivirga sp. IMCC43871]|uniref:alpha/beta hydrolase n=1 Tax=Rubrivirga sp. IMCC43871 TaxID=3391575 RepID=UPI00398FB86A
MRTLVLLSLLSTAVVAQPSVAGHWEGALTFRGAEMPVRLRVAPSGDSLRAALDVPSLILAGLPLPATPTPGGLEVTFPFGLGALPVVPEGDAVTASTPLAEDTLSLRLQRSGPPPYTSEEITVASGGVELAGTLILPEGAPPHPAVVLVHGSGRQGRHTDAYRSWADLLAREGLAVVLFDKRGGGASSGDPDADLRTLADDVVAVARALGARPEVDAGRVGLMGWSQGGWVAEMAAADLGDTAFLLLVSAAGGTPREQEIAKVAAGMRDDARPEAEVEDALAFLGLYFYVARTGEGWPLLAEATAHAQGAPWGQYVDQPRTPDDLVWWRANHAVRPSLDSLGAPALLLYGGADWITPPADHAEPLRRRFPAAARAEAHTFPRADHRLEVPSWTDEAGQWHWPQIAPGVRETVARWLRANGLASGATR